MTSVMCESPMVPFNLPIIGHTINYIFNAEKFLTEYRKENKISSKGFKEHDVFDHEQVLLETLIFPLAFKYSKVLIMSDFLLMHFTNKYAEDQSIYTKNGIDL
ncbi:hypothetical protein C2G38_2034381 [Gigaspora rosea]|uniref:Uncharacterized protein n=1 Tax=Gigaspora rosea TaxID=44941 RepID=A0A397VG60_9GLOM|nr:hypothetical protein C2G38_2034381 [Gigaspora rosea]